MRFASWESLKALGHDGDDSCTSGKTDSDIPGMTTSSTQIQDRGI